MNLGTEIWTSRSWRILWTYLAYKNSVKWIRSFTSSEHLHDVPPPLSLLAFSVQVPQPFRIFMYYIVWKIATHSSSWTAPGSHSTASVSGTNSDWEIGSFSWYLPRNSSPPGGSIYTITSFASCWGNFATAYSLYNNGLFALTSTL